MPRLFLHIGAHKTGTTSIQKFLETNAAFLTQHGFVYPRICWFGHAQHRLSLAVRGAPDPDVGDRPVLEEELAALRNCMESSQADVIISSEGFFAVPENKLRRFAAEIKAFDVQVIACIRRQDNLCMSNYNERTKRAGNKLTRPITFYLDDPLAISPDLDLLGCLNTWASHFGRERMITYCYENGDAISEFLRILKIPVPEHVTSTKRANVALPAKALELMRLVKTMNQDTAVKNILLSEATLAFAGTGSILLGPKERSRILKRFEADNEKVFATYLNSENLYSEKHWSAEFEALDKQPMEPLNRNDLLKVLIEMASIFARLGISPELLRENSMEADE